MRSHYSCCAASPFLSRSTFNTNGPPPSYTLFHYASEWILKKACQKSANDRLMRKNTDSGRTALSGSCRSNPLARNAALETRRPRQARRGTTSRMVATTSSGAASATDEDAGSDEPGCSMDELVGLCKRRGFVFPSSEVCPLYALRYITIVAPTRDSGCVHVFNCRRERASGCHATHAWSLIIALAPYVSVYIWMFADFPPPRRVSD